MRLKDNAWVWTDKEHGWVSLDDPDYEFENVEESPWGDVIYFTYKGEEYSSNVVRGSKPE